jgi:hypothetical protein
MDSPWHQVSCGELDAAVDRILLTDVESGTFPRAAHSGPGLACASLFVMNPLQWQAAAQASLFVKPGTLTRRQSVPVHCTIRE